MDSTIVAEEKLYTLVFLFEDSFDEMEPITTSEASMEYVYWQHEGGRGKYRSIGGFPGLDISMIYKEYKSYKTSNPVPTSRPYHSISVDFRSGQQ